MAIPISCPAIDEIIRALYNILNYTDSEDKHTLQNYINVIFSNLEQIREINKDLRTDAGDLLVQIEEHENTIDKLEDQISDLNSEVFTLNEKVNDLQKELDDSEGETATLEMEIITLEKQIEQLQKDYDDVFQKLG